MSSNKYHLYSVEYGCLNVRVVLKGSTDYDFYQKKNKYIDFVYRKKTSELSFCS